MHGAPDRTKDGLQRYASAQSSGRVRQRSGLSIKHGNKKHGFIIDALHFKHELKNSFLI